MYETSESATSLSTSRFLAPVIRLNTRPLPPRTQYAAWLDACANLTDLDPDAEPSAGFDADLAAWDLGGVALVHACVPALSFRRSLDRIRIDALDHWVLSAALEGQARMDSAAQSAELEPGVVAVHSLGQALAGRTLGLRSINLVVPRDFCREAATQFDAAGGATLRTGLSQLLADYLANLDRCLPNVTVDELPALLASVRSMILACVTPSPDRFAEARHAIDATMLERARQLVQRRLLSPTLGADEICRELGVSRSRLYRLFEPMGGVVHYVRRRRLLDAHVALGNPEERRPIVDIAAERGFIDAAEFSRAFKREFGYRPSDARSRSNVWPLRRPRSGKSATNLPELLRRLQ